MVVDLETEIDDVHGILPQVSAIQPPMIHQNW